MASPRTCSRCGIPGHTKRHCLIPRKEEEIIIRTSTEVAPSSRHILSLRHEAEPRAWDTVESYNTPAHEEPKRVALDFAELVREERSFSDIFAEVDKQDEVIEVNESILIETNTTEEPVVMVEEPVSLIEEPVLTAEDLSFADAKQADEPVEVALYTFSPDVEKREKVTGVTPQLFTPLTQAPKKTWFSRAKKPTKEVPRVSYFPVHVRRIAAGSLAFLILLTVPLPAKGYVDRLKMASTKVVEDSTNGFLALQSSTVAALGADMPKAGEDLTRALQAFESAQQKIQGDYAFVVGVGKWLPIVGKHIESRQNLLEAGQHVALANTYVLKGMQDIMQRKDDAFTVRLETLRTHLRSALPQYQAALANIEAVDEAGLPEEYRETYQSAKGLFTVFVEDVEDILALTDGLEKVLGDTSFKRYLVVFQNPHELRPTGGFVGSFAIVDVQKGAIKRIEVPKGGSYDIQGQFSKYLRPPVPLQLANSRFEFQDANWWPDFSISGEKLASFYEGSRQETVDGVIAVNATVLERVLSILGPLQDEEFNLVLSQYDALEKIQEHVESIEQRATNEPKAILSNMLSGLMSQLPTLGKGDLVKLMSELHAALAQKEIQVYFRDPEVQRTFRSFDWTGELMDVAPHEDYLMVVGANIQGQKSDARVEETITHTATIAPNGTVEDVVVIKRVHAGTEGESLYGVPNIHYVRVYVPLGAELISAEGFNYPPEAAFKVPENWYRADTTVEVFEAGENFHPVSGMSVGEEQGRTVFGHWMMVSPGDTVEATLKYRLPRPLSVKGQEVPSNRFEAVTSDLLGKTPTLRSTYMLNIEKQSGINVNFESRVIYPETWVPFWRAHDNEKIENGELVYRGVLNTDERVGAIFEQAYEK